jgi:putative glutamine amidotransferase
MLPKPLIGITTTQLLNPSRQPAFGVNVAYTDAVTAAGGLPVLIPLNLSNDELDGLLYRLDGILFTGGYDIDPRIYGGRSHPSVERIDKSRDEIEIHLVQSLMKSTKSFLGICRGLQVINVAMGGSLYEHIPDQAPGEVIHDNHHLPRNFLAHQVTIKTRNHLSEIVAGSEAFVNSLHHQGICNLANDLFPTAYAPDGLIEAFELPGHPFGLAVQWHPEELQEQEVMRRLFQSFIQSCQVNQSL